MRILGERPRLKQPFNDPISLAQLATFFAENVIRINLINMTENPLTV